MDAESPGVRRALNRAMISRIQLLLKLVIIIGDSDGNTFLD